MWKYRISQNLSNFQCNITDFPRRAPLRMPSRPCPGDAVSAPRVSEECIGVCKKSWKAAVICGIETKFHLSLQSCGHPEFIYGSLNYIYINSHRPFWDCKKSLFGMDWPLTSLENTRKWQKLAFWNWKSPAFCMWHQAISPTIVNYRLVPLKWHKTITTSQNFTRVHFWLEKASFYKNFRGLAKNADTHE